MSDLAEGLPAVPFTALLLAVLWEIAQALAAIARHLDGIRSELHQREA